jgi:competence protein ComGC
MKMKSYINNEDGFTLIEMLLVMLVITVLLLIMIPNVTKNSGVIGDKGCEALLSMVDAQIQTYKLDNGKGPEDMEDLNTEEYLGDKFVEGELKCPNGEGVVIADGKAIKDED